MYYKYENTLLTAHNIFSTIYTYVHATISLFDITDRGFSF